MTAPWDWLSRATHHHQDFAWLSENIEEIYEALRADIHRPPTLHRAIDTLLLIYPYLLTRNDLHRWTMLLDDALSEATDRLRDETMQMRLYQHIGQSYTRLGQPQTARVAFGAALVRAEEQKLHDSMLKAYIGLFQIQMYRQVSDFTPELIQKALALANTHSDWAVRAALYQAIAFGYNYRRETMMTLGYGQTAYAYYNALGNKAEMARTAYELASACRQAKRFDQAQRFLEQAKTLYAQTHEKLQYTLTTYEQGAVYVEQGLYEEAEQWMTTALDELVRLEPPHYKVHSVAVCYQGLALAQIGLKKYDEARSNLEIALGMWQRLDNKYELASTLNALGYITGRQGQKEAALEDFRKALRLCDELPDSASKHYLIDNLRASIRELE
jgi:tetratricopeptide (TPR) repeat protein